LPDLFTGVPMPTAVPVNRLYYGDNLTIMRDSMASESVDLIYLDPPFNSQRTYNLIYKQLTGLPVPEQEEAFCDAWEMDAEKEELARNMPVVLAQYGVDDDVVMFWQAWIKALRSSQPRLLAYLVYMTYRLFEMRRILKPTGSIYLHCDPAASHYIKVMMDGVFGHGAFRNEIVWKRTSAHSSAKRYGPVHDTILYYARGDSPTWNEGHQAYDAEYLERFTRGGDGRYFKAENLTGAGTRKGETGKPWRGFNVTIKGRHWAYPPSVLDQLDAEGRIYWPKKPGGWPRIKQFLDESKGVPLQDVWTDVYPINSQADERLGYPTQKPLALLERIIKASTNEGDVVFDPFAGCGTAIYAAHLNNRYWLGCDIAILSVQIVRDVLLKRYGLQEDEDYKVSGVPLSVEGARELFDHDKRQFQHWVVELAGGFCNKRQSGDEGVDGRIWFDTHAGLRSMVVSVKGGGQLNPSFIREVRGTMEADPAAEMAGFICMEKPTKGMLQEAAKAGMYKYLGKEYPRVQIRTVEELLDERTFDTPSRVRTLAWEKQTKLAI
jgi:DNA modification methylase